MSITASYANNSDDFKRVYTRVKYAKIGTSSAIVNSTVIYRHTIEMFALDYSALTSMSASCL